MTMHLMYHYTYIAKFVVPIYMHHVKYVWVQDIVKARKYTGQTAVGISCIAHSLLSGSISAINA